MNEREELLRKLSGAGFAAFEMQLFLDTHKSNSEALKSMKEYDTVARTYRKEFEQKFGPLTANDLYGNTTYEWLNAPWPWENESEAKI